MLDQHVKKVQTLLMVVFESHNRGIRFRSYMLYLHPVWSLVKNNNILHSSLNRV